MMQSLIIRANLFLFGDEFHRSVFRFRKLSDGLVSEESV